MLGLVVLGALGALGALGCGDYGDPVSPQTVDPYAIEHPDILLLEWEAQGAIPAADVNHDGTVDIRDLVLVAQSFGQDVIIEDPPVRVDAWEVRQMNTYTWSYKLTVTNTSPDEERARFVARLFDVDGFYLDTESLSVTVPASSTITKRSEFLFFGADEEHYDEDGNRVLSVELFPQNAEEFVALFKQT
jgi:hypothetical protein